MSSSSTSSPPEIIKLLSFDFTDNSPIASPSSRFERSVSPSASTSSYESIASTAATSVTGDELNDKLGLSQQSQQQDASEGITPESLSNHKEKKKKDGSSKKNPNKTSSRISSATGISSLVPVTGERPRPEQHPSLEDTVFFTIFQILFDHDPDTKGMTVKQICDILAEQHPEMAKLSTKTSNLVSAKLNAYVKRVEKGEREIIYALSRDWADASPKRMVYVYRGLLTPDYYITAKSLWEKLELEGTLFPDRSKDEEKKMKKEEKKALANSSSSNTPMPMDIDKDDIESVSSLNNTSSTTTTTKQRRATMFDLGINRPALSSSFTEGALDLHIPTLSIPYQVAPVTASLGCSQHTTSLTTIQSQSKSKPLLKTKDEFELDDEFDTFYENDEFDNNDFTKIRDASKRSKSMSFIPNKKGKYITALALAPRVPRTPTISPSQLAALHAAAFKELSPTTIDESHHHHHHHEIDEDVEIDDDESVSSDFKTLSVSSPFAGSSKIKKRSSFTADVSVSAKWLKTVRSGFLTQEIGIPEEVSLSELDSMFT